MGLALIIAIFALPVLLAWVILRKRDRWTSSDDYGGPEDEAPPHEVTLRQYTVTGETDYPSPAAGYADPEAPRD